MEGNVYQQTYNDHTVFEQATYKEEHTAFKSVPYPKELTDNKGTKLFPCPTCHRKFSLQWNQKRHSLYCKLPKQDQRTLGCDICGKKFFRNDILKDHIAGVHGNPKYGCKYCDQRFRWRSAMHKHMKTCCLIPDWDLLIDKSVSIMLLNIINEY